MISVFGGLADFLTRVALQRLGLTPVKDVAMIQMERCPGAAERSWRGAGRVQGAMLPRPDNFVALKKGFHNLMTVRLPYQKHGSSHNPQRLFAKY